MFFPEDYSSKAYYNGCHVRTLSQLTDVFTINNQQSDQDMIMYPHINLNIYHYRIWAFINKIIIFGFYLKRLNLKKLICLGWISIKQETNLIKH